MKRIFVAMILSTVGVGCASSAAIQQGAYQHQAKADAYEARGDYYHAANERAAADKQFAKARRRAWDEAAAGVYWY